MSDSIGKFAKPVNKLIDVIAKACGAYFKPHQIERIAKAEARADVIRAEGKEQAALIKQRTQHKLEHQEILRQKNIDNITANALDELPSELSVDPVDLDWTIQFFNYAQDVNDNDMQILWGRILAGEVARPGSYSKRTIDFLRTLEKWEAEAFTSFCSAAVQFNGGRRAIIYGKPYDNFIQSKFPHKSIEEHLVAIGLLTHEYQCLNINEQNKFTVQYFGKTYSAELKTTIKNTNHSIKKLDRGFDFRHFSLIGQQLAEIAGAKPIPKFIQLISDEMEVEHGFQFKEQKNPRPTTAKKRKK